MLSQGALIIIIIIISIITITTIIIPRTLQEPQEVPGGAIWS